MNDWGNKVVIYIYVEGERPTSTEIIRASQRAADELNQEKLGFVGVRVERVKEKPYDQTAT